ncbi:MAG: hypothetical protein K2Q01_09465 [Rickettsiales bacterium]|nr:hypothetical protein [Rickettsiales bacterium]
MAKQEQPPTLEKKPSFFSSVMSGIGGYIKGAITAGLAGGFGGAIIGAIVGGIGLALGGPVTLAAGAAAVGMSALGGAAIGGSILASLGAVAGMVTGVVRSREAKQPSAEDIVNVAKISFAQGVNVGAHVERAQGKGKHETAYLEEKSRVALAERQVSH